MLLSNCLIGEPYDDAKDCWRIGGGINAAVNVTLKANKSKRKKFKKRLLIQREIQVNNYNNLYRAHAIKNSRAHKKYHLSGAHQMELPINFLNQPFPA